jgi:hypothetical protein
MNEREHLDEIQTTNFDDNVVNAQKKMQFIMSFKSFLLICHGNWK